MAAALAMSVFGSLQVVALVSARIPYAMAADGLFFSALGRSARARASRFARCRRRRVWAIVLVFSGSYDTITDYAIFAVLIFVVARHGVGVRVPPPACPTPSARTGRGAIRSCRSCSCWSATAIVINTLVTTPDRALAGVGLMLLGPAVLLVLVAQTTQPT